MFREHECKRQGFRVAEYSKISGGGWFLDTREGKVNIFHCPYCGKDLSTEQ